MPSIEEGRDALLQAGQRVSRGSKSTLKSFTDWAFQDNIIEIASGLIIATAFTAIINSLTSDIILPIVSLLPFLNRNLEEKFAVLRGGPRYDRGEAGYNTVEQALDDGAVVLAYGSFLDKVVRFFIVGFSLYAIGRVYGWASSDNIIKYTVKCKYCRKRISEKAKRCVNCTSWLDGRED